MELPKIQKAKGLKGKRVLLRLGLNIPVKNGRVVDAFRILKAIPTIQYLQKKGAKIIIISHIGRDSKETLRPVVNYFNRRLNIKMGFIPEHGAELAEGMIEHMTNGSVILLENLRQHEGEKKNDVVFAKYLAGLAEIYVNDAFSVSHRKHASVHAVTRYLPSYAGLLFQDEVKHLEMALNPKHPFLFVLGGAKIATKMPLLRKFTKLADMIFVGGALANDLYKAKGYEIGKSLADGDVKGISALAKNVKVIVPPDTIVKTLKGDQVRIMGDVKKTDSIMDAGPVSQKSFSDLISKQKFILINGPLGYYEGGYDKATKKLLKVAAASRAKVIVGGGDTVAMVTKMKLEDEFTFLSTGGGAMLDFLADGKLPAIDMLIKCKHNKI